MSELHIGKPYLEFHDNKTRLCSDIRIDGNKKVFYYEVEKEYGMYLCTERSDAFLVSLVQYAMSNNLDISWETPVTERLAYQLRMIFIPVISKKYHLFFNSITLSGETTSDELVKDQWAVGTGASGGVDSFYSILKHLSTEERSCRVTHLLYVAISNHSVSEEILRKDFEINLPNIQKIADDLNLPLITLYSNESDFFFKNIVNWGAFRFAGMVYSLQKLFSIYYFSSGYPYEDITFGDGTGDFDSLKFDLFTLMTASTRSLNFVGSGGETDRSGKVKYIENNDTVKKRLFVCNYRSDYNCSCCDKCMRTMMQLYVDGCLEQYADVFDLTQFKNRKDRYLTKMLYRRSKFDKEIVHSMAGNKPVPYCCKVKAAVIRPIYVIWQKLKQSRSIMNIFYNFNLDYKLYGKDMAESIRYSKGIRVRKSKKI